MSEKNIQAFRREATVVPATGETNIRRVAAYCRVSTLQEEQEDSYELQCDYYRKRIDADPTLTLVDVYGDHGISGLSAVKRPEFQRMMNDCMAGKIDLVMSKSVSRFARNLGDCLKCIRELREKGIPVIFEKEGLNTMDPSCEMLLSVLATLAQEESNNISQSIRWAHEYRNAAGNPARKVRYGYKKVKKDGVGRWEIYEPEAERVRLAFKMTCEGYGYKDILDALNALEARDKTEVRWTHSRIYGLLTSEVYMGDILTNKSYKLDLLVGKQVKNRGQRHQYYIENHHAAIVDRDTFHRAGEIVAARNKRAGRVERRQAC